MIILFVLVHHRNRYYGNEYYDKTCRYEVFEKLREIEKLSHEVAQFTIITVRRRIGKTEMVKKFYENNTMLYFFVARKAEADLCDKLFIDKKKFTEKKMMDMFFERDSYFLSEGKNMLVEEFGKDYGSLAM